MSAADRSEYALRQAQLLDALLLGGEPPEGFAAEQADIAGRSLRRKRGRAVAGAWPALAIDLGESFAAHYDEFARGAFRRSSADPLQDGLAFARWMAGKARPGDDARVELLLARAALQRRGMFVRVVLLRRPHPRLLLVARLPWTGPIRRSCSCRFGWGAKLV